MRQRIYAHLKELARLQSHTNYRDLAAAVGGHPRNLGETLASINEEELQAGRRMLSVLVVKREDNRPGKGFYTCARLLGLFDGRGADSREDFFCAEMERVHKIYRLR